MTSNNKQAKRRLKQLGATLNPSKVGWSDSEDEDIIQEGMHIELNMALLQVLN